MNIFAFIYLAFNLIHYLVTGDNAVYISSLSLFWHFAKVCWFLLNSIVSVVIKSGGHSLWLKPGLATQVLFKPIERTKLILESRKGTRIHCDHIGKRDKDFPSIAHRPSLWLEVRLKFKQWPSNVPIQHILVKGWYLVALSHLCLGFNLVLQGVPTSCWNCMNLSQECTFLLIMCISWGNSHFSGFHCFGSIVTERTSVSFQFHLYQAITATDGKCQ